jgi:hypothetical protein
VKPRPSQLEQARKLLASAKAGAQVEVTSSVLCRCLVYILGERPDDTERDLIGRLVLGSPHARARELLALWENVPSRRAAIAVALSSALDARSRPFVMPDWLPRTEPERRRALVAPHAFCLRGLERNLGSIDTVGDRLGVVLHSRLGHELLLHALVHGSDRFWGALGSPLELREWARPRDTRTQAAIADRQLVAIGRGVTAPYNLPDDAETKHLTEWVFSTLRSPDTHAARWDGVSDRGREVFDWLLIRDEIVKILALFEQQATQSDRGEFWKKQAHRIRDARFVDLDEMAVCLIVIGETLVVEFGDYANAGYVYGVPAHSPSVRRPANLPNRAGSFKQRGYHLKIGAVVYPFKDRIIHAGDWQTRTGQAIAQWAAGWSRR